MPVKALRTTLIPNVKGATNIESYTNLTYV